MREERSGLLGLVVQIVLLALPLLVLIALGIHFLQQDKYLLEKEAIERAEDLTRRVAVTASEIVTNLNPAVYVQFTNEWPVGTAFLQLTTNSDLVFPPPIRGSDPFLNLWAELTIEQSNVWRRAERAEFETNNLAAAVEFRDQLLQSNLSGRLETIARFQRAIVQAKQGETVSEEFAELASVAVTNRLDSGLPVAHLAGLKLLQNGEALQSADEWRNAFLSNLLAEPTEYTGFFLEQVGKMENTARVRAVRRVWEQHSEARAQWERLAAAHREGNAPVLGSAVNDSTGARWVYSVVQTNVFAWREEELKRQLSEIIEQVQPPGHLQFAVWIGGERIIPAANIPEGPLWASKSSEVVRCEAYLADSSELYARQRQRARLLGGLLAGCALFAVAGIANAHRNFRRQQRLSELKSNFVSSVSHELRAPLASLRLISEGLQSGRVRDPEKQREYFQFLVQECRRLSVLVENVLDFSRIEQNRKTYRFEPADLRGVAEAALQSVSAVAAENQISMQFHCDSPNGDFITAVDPMAIQQALVNLLDNAIKHSPPGAKVQLTLRSLPEQFEFAVQDEGPGIPTPEQDRIFERFYRLGSELRRETQGVGIGLSIVKHTAAAHSGSITVRSSTGTGATFTLALPKKETV